MGPQLVAYINLNTAVCPQLRPTMASLADQLSKVKLKKSTEPIRDYSNPKLAGFMSKEDVTAYQNSVLDVNTEQWLETLKEETFPSTYCPISLQEAQLFVSVYEREYKDKDPTTFHAIDWKANLSDSDQKFLKAMTQRLQQAIDEITQSCSSGHAFVKTSCRSAKDAPVYQNRFSKLFQKELDEQAPDVRTKENAMITCLLKAAFEAQRVSLADQVLDMFMCSERIYQDMLLALEQKERFHENFVIREFVDIDVDMEFRGFVYAGELTAVCQYNYLIYSSNLCAQKDSIRDKLHNYFTSVVQPKMQLPGFPKDFIIDFAICEKGQKIWVIEINPFLTTTDGAMFSWEHERHLLEGKEGFQFRVVEKPKPGALTMLPSSLKDLLKSMKTA